MSRVAKYLGVIALFSVLVSQVHAGEIENLERVVQKLVPPPFVPNHEQVATGNPKIVEVRLVVEEKPMVIDEDGTVNLNELGMFTSVDILTAASIDASGLTLGTGTSGLDVFLISGGNGQILRLAPPQLAPEPSTFVLAGLLLLLLGGYVWRQRRIQSIHG